jgi:indole-3-acetate monooxygenase
MTATETQSPLDAAQNLAPMIRSCADQIEANRELPRPLFEALADAGLFRLALPHVLGGAEIDLPAYVQVLEEIGKADASTGWVVNQCAIFATYAARMPRDIARLIWSDTPRSIVANTPLPTGQAVAVPGGYRVTGRQGFSSGCRHAAWLAARAHIFENGQPRLKDGQPEERYLFVPAAEAELLDTWHVRGMRGTGTHDFVVSDVFVPAERTVLQAGAPLLETGPLYEIPRSLLFASGDAAPRPREPCRRCSAISPWFRPRSGTAKLTFDRDELSSTRWFVSSGPRLYQPAQSPWISARPYALPLPTRFI